MAAEGRLALAPLGPYPGTALAVGELATPGTAFLFWLVGFGVVALTVG